MIFFAGLIDRNNFCHFHIKDTCFEWCVTYIRKGFSYVESYLFHNILVYSVVTRRGCSYTLIHDSQHFLFDSGVKEHVCLCICMCIVINACFIYRWFDVFGEIWSNVDKEFIETIGNVLLSFICFIFIYKMVWKWSKNFISFDYRI